MTIYEYAMARQVGVLTEESKTRPLTTEEMQFLARTRALMERLRAKEAK
jgi:hypothetical protein